MLKKPCSSRIWANSASWWLDSKTANPPNTTKAFTQKKKERTASLQEWANTRNFKGFIEAYAGMMLAWWPLRNQKHLGPKWTEVKKSRCDVTSLPQIYIFKKKTPLYIWDFEDNLQQTPASACSVVEIPALQSSVTSCSVMCGRGDLWPPDHPAAARQHQRESTDICCPQIWADLFETSANPQLIVNVRIWVMWTFEAVSSIFLRSSESFVAQTAAKTTETSLNLLHQVKCVH